MTREHEYDREMLRGTSGLYVGQLTPNELESFHRLRAAGIARADYRGRGGSMGLAKVCIDEARGA